MYSIGLDIGTTNISFALLDLKTGVPSRTFSVPSGSDVPFDDPDQPFSCQRIDVILSKVTEGLRSLVDAHPGEIASIGVTGQMHGIVYLDGALNPLGDLITWRDRRGNLPYRCGKTYSEYLSSVTGHHVPAGYGAVTLFHDFVSGLIPKGTEVIATIMDFVAAKLSGSGRILMHPQNAAAIGLFDIASGSFDRAAIIKAGLDCSLFPEIASEECTVLGRYEGTVPVTVALGDNQASFIGSVKDPSSYGLVNVGTGSQVSLVTSSLKAAPGIEIRPFVDGKYLAVGSAICGGKALAYLASLIGDIVDVSGGSRDPYDIINEVMGSSCERSPLTVDTRFFGTREDPSVRGSISSITGENLTLKNLIGGFLDGISGELYELYTRMPESSSNPVLIGSGSGLRKNPSLKARIERDFGKKVTLPEYEEEAAVGAARYAARAVI